jgi:hypothetical protein
LREERCADGEVPAAAADVEGAGNSGLENLSWGAGEGAMAIAALIMKRASAGLWELAAGGSYCKEMKELQGEAKKAKAKPVSEPE